jgi:hypothetical protein
MGTDREDCLRIAAEAFVRALIRLEERRLRALATNADGS